MKGYQVYLCAIYSFVLCTLLISKSHLNIRKIIFLKRFIRIRRNIIYYKTRLNPFLESDLYVFDFDTHEYSNLNLTKT